MSKPGKFKIALALMSIPSAVHAQTAPKCIPKPQVRDATIVLMPFLIDATRKRCTASLPATAFLKSTAATDFANRLEKERPAREHSAAEALRALGGDDPDSRLMSDKTILNGVGEMLAGKAVEKADSNRCDDLNSFLDALSPMPAEKVGVLVTAFFSIADVGGDKSGSPKICAT